MSKNAVQNQANPPLPKKKRVDSQGNHRYRIIAKDHHSTMVIAEGVTENGYKLFASKIDSLIKAIGKQTVEFKRIQ